MQWKFMSNSVILKQFVLRVILKCFLICPLLDFNKIDTLKLSKSELGYLEGLSL